MYFVNTFYKVNHGRFIKRDKSWRDSLKEFQVTTSGEKGLTFSNIQLPYFDLKTIKTFKCD